MSQLFKHSTLSMAVLMTLSVSASVSAATTDYSNQTLDTAISVIGEGNNVTGDNVKITGPGYVETSTRNEGIYVGNGSSAHFGGDYLEVNFSADDTSLEFAGVQVNSQGDGASVEFASKSTVIDVKGPSASGKWGFGLLVNGTQGASANFTGGDVLIRSETENYTSQTVTVKAGSTINFNNVGDVTVESYSPFGVTVVDAQGTINFNNKGNVLLKGAIVPGDSTAQTNVVGIQGGDASWSISENVGEFKISLSGAGVDSNGTSYSTGTKAIDAYGSDMSISVNSRDFVIEMDVASNVTDDSPDGHTAEEAFAIFLDYNAQLNIAQNTNTSITVNEGLGDAYGMYVTYGADVNIEGNTTINVVGEKNSYAIKVDGVDNYYGEEGVNPPSVTLGGQENHITGDVVASNESAVSFENGSTTLNGNAKFDESSLMALDSASVDLAEGNTIAVAGELTSNNGQIILNEAAEGIVSIGSLTDGSSLEAVASSTLNDKLNGDITTFSQAFSIDQGAEAVSVLMKEGMVAGETTGQLTEDGTIDQGSVVRKTNTLMQSTLEMASAAPLTMTRVLTNDVRKRLGDIRSDEGTSGVWARYDGGEFSGSNNFESDFNTIQVGFDTKFSPDSARYGVAFSYTDGESDYARGSSDMEAFSLAGYATWMLDNGAFVDVVGRAATVDNDMTVDANKTGTMDNLLFSLSAEAGWRFNVTDTFYVEPQAEVMYTYVDSDDFKIDTAKYSVDSTDSLVGRVGFATGFKCPNNYGDVYARASVAHEFLGDARITGQSAGSYGVYETNGSDTWFEYGIGGNFNITKSTYVWADVERTGGATVDEDWRATVGVRYAW